MKKEKVRSGRFYVDGSFEEYLDRGSTSDEVVVEAVLDDGAEGGAYEDEQAEAEALERELGGKGSRRGGGRKKGAAKKPPRDRPSARRAHPMRRKK